VHLPVEVAKPTHAIWTALQVIQRKDDQVHPKAKIMLAT
jgi:hypothetical protein